MPYTTYKILHIVGLVLLFMSLGATLLGGRDEGQKPPKMAMILHGIGLLILLVAGFGLLARLEYTSFPWPNWAMAKLGIWVLLALMPVLVRRGILPTAIGWIVAAALGGTAAWLAIGKPF